MTEYNEGDLVEAVKGESLIRARLVQRPDALWLGAGGSTVQYYEILGYTITVIAKAAPVVVLPTEPGAYMCSRGSLWVLNGNHDWLDFSAGTGGVNNQAAANPFYHPFTPLAPVSETAKKVLDRVRKVWPLYNDRDLEVLAAEFGVTE